MKFPADYPAGCLLGCVDLLDCLTQEQYRSQYPDGEVEDPYVFICENPLALPVRYPVKGKPNICKELDFVVFFFFKIEMFVWKTTSGTSQI